jgi:hypothetical protein
MAHLISTKAISPFDVTDLRPMFESDSQHGIPKDRYISESILEMV